MRTIGVVTVARSDHGRLNPLPWGAARAAARAGRTASTSMPLVTRSWIRRALDSAFRAPLAGLDDGHAAPRIARALADVGQGPRLLRKRLVE